MAKKIKLKKSRRLAGRLLLSSAAGNLQMFKEFMVQIGYFDGRENKALWNDLGKLQKDIRQIRKSLGKKGQPVNNGEVEAGYARGDDDKPASGEKKTPSHTKK